MYPTEQLALSEVPTATHRTGKPPTEHGKSTFLIRLKSWEYWPFAVVYAPVIAYWLWLSLRARSLFFFSAANPSIESGGMLGESKIDILDKIDDAYKPRTLLVTRDSSIDQLHEIFSTFALSIPIIAKPDAGERGWGVEKIHDLQELEAYHANSPVDYLIQEYVDYPLEFGVFYYRMPEQSKGVVSSIVQKEFLSVTGDGHGTLAELVAANDRAVLQWDVLKEKYAASWERVLPQNETLTLVAIGNHCLGTKFLNANHLITPELTAVFDKISADIPGFYFGRYDLRCQSLADFDAGRYLKIMELNGAGAEPGHIYQPGTSVWEGWRVLLHHWKVLYKISRLNHRNGVPYLTLKEARKIMKRIKAAKKSTN